MQKFPPGWRRSQLRSPLARGDQFTASARAIEGAETFLLFRGSWRGSRSSYDGRYFLLDKRILASYRGGQQIICIPKVHVPMSASGVSASSSSLHTVCWVTHSPSRLTHGVGYQCETWRRRPRLVADRRDLRRYPNSSDIGCPSRTFSTPGDRARGSFTGFYFLG
jgi:hypothetical protein